MEIDDDPEDSPSRERSPHMCRLDDQNDDVNGGDARTSDDVPLRIVELVSRDPIMEPSEGPRPGPSGINLSRSVNAPVTLSPAVVFDDDDCLNVGVAVGVGRNRDSDEPPLQRRRLNPNEARSYSRHTSKSSSGRRVGFVSSVNDRSSRRNDPINNPGPSQRFSHPLAEDHVFLDGGPPQNHRSGTSRRDVGLEADMEPLIILDTDGVDSMNVLPMGAALPLDLRRDLAPADVPVVLEANVFCDAAEDDRNNRVAPHVQVQVVHEDLDEDDEEEEVETVEDSAPEDEGEPPPGDAEVTDDDSEEEEEEDVESDAATAGSSLSESRERALGGLGCLPNLAPVAGGSSGSSSGKAIDVVKPAAASVPEGSGAGSLAERDSMPPPPPGGPRQAPIVANREESASPGRFEEKLSHANHCPHMLSGLLSLRQEGVLCDFTLIADGQHFPVHKIVLCACSDYFRAMFTQNLVEARSDSVELQGVTAGGLKILLNFIYTGELAVSLDSVAEVVGAATHLQVLEVVRMCSTYLKRHLGLDNCVDVLGLAELYSLCRLREHALQFLCQHLQEFLSEGGEDGNGQQLQRLTHDQLHVILQSNSLQVQREVEVFQVAVRWLQHAWSERRSYAAVLMECVRFPLLTGEELVDVVEKEDFMSSDPQCHKLILEAYQYAILPSRQHLMQTLRTQVRSSPSLVVLGGPWDFVPIFPFPFSTSARSNVAARPQGIAHLQWQQGNNAMVYKTNGAGVAALDNYIFLIGGQISQEDRTKSGACYRYDPRTNKWLTLRPMNRARAFLAVVTKDKKIYAIGGQGRGSRPKSSCEVYDCISGDWSAMATLPQYALLASACNFRNTIFVSGGHPDAGILKLTNENTWETVASLPEARYRHTMLGAGSSLYIIGGRAIKHVGGRRQYPVPSTIVSYNLDTSAWSSFSLQPGPSTPLASTSGPPPFDPALNGSRMTLFSHPLLKAFHVNNSLYVVTKDSIYRSSGFPSPNGFGKWRFVAANPQTFTADMAFCLIPLPSSSFQEAGGSNNGSNNLAASQYAAAAASMFAPNGRGAGHRNHHQLGGHSHRVRLPSRAHDGHDEEIFINWEVLEG